MMASDSVRQGRGAWLGSRWCGVESCGAAALSEGHRSSRPSTAGVGRRMVGGMDVQRGDSDGNAPAGDGGVGGRGHLGSRGWGGGGGGGGGGGEGAAGGWWVRRRALGPVAWDVERLAGATTHLHSRLPI